MKHIVFVTPELHPVTRGGAGVFVDAAVRALAEEGYRCTVVCRLPVAELARANAVLSKVPVGSGTIRLVEAPLPSRRGWLPRSHYDVESAAYCDAIRRLHRTEPIDLIEFPDWSGMAFHTLRARQVDGVLSGVRIAVRAHGTLELIDRAERVVVTDRARLRMHAMERLALRMADVVLVPSKGTGDLYARTYGLEPDRLASSPLPMRQILRGLVPLTRRLVNPGHFLFYGKLQEVKGIDVLVEAAASLLTEEPGRDWRFTIVGRDTLCSAHGRSVSRCIAPSIPYPYRRAFQFIPDIDRGELVQLATHAIAGVVPSRFETFSLAAHELRAIGLPLIVPRIAGFVEHLHESTGSLTYDGSVSGLREAILRIGEEPGLAESLASRPMSSYAAFPLAYAGLLATPRALTPTESLQPFETLRPNAAELAIRVSRALRRRGRDSSSRQLPVAHFSTE
jgi:glycosyltransferase involved in cell wall biosynthesis